MRSEYTLYNGDCLEVMPTLEAGSIDLTVTSPPYDNLRDYGHDFDSREFDWKPVIKELYRITRSGGVVVWIVADATIKGSETGTSFRQALWAMECGFRLHDTMIWAKFGSGLPHDAHRYGQSFEYMFVWAKGVPRHGTIECFQESRKTKKTTRRQKNGTIKRGTYKEGGGKLPNLWKTKGESFGNHPAVFPESLAFRHVLSWSNSGQTILDPFMGSGTTGVACARTGRNFIGIELDKGYFEMASERIRHAYAETPLPKKLDNGKTQLSLFQHNDK